MLLIVEDDPHYARVLLGLARDKGFKGIVANRGAAGVCAGAAVPADRDHARRLPARHARLDGAQQPQARSGDAAHPGADPLGRGGAAARPVARRLLLPGQAGDDRGPRARLRPHQERTSRRTRKRLLVVEDNDIERAEHRRAARRTTTSRSRRSRTGARRSSVLRDQPVDCCVLDLRLPDMTGFELLERMQEDEALRDMPVVVFTGKDLTADEEARLTTRRQEHRAQGRAVAGAAVRRDRALPAPRRRRPAGGQAPDARAAARLERRPARPQGAGRRRRRAQHLRADDACSRTRRWRCSAPPTAGRRSSSSTQTPDLSVVLMDIMMPEMDGYETMREIRNDPRVPDAADPRADRQGDEGRPREVPRRPARPTTSPSRSTPTSCCRCCASGCTAEAESM